MKSKGKKAVSSTVFHPGLMHKLSVKITDQNDMNEELVNFRSISKPHTMTDIISRGGNVQLFQVSQPGLSYIPSLLDYNEISIFFNME